MTRGDIVTIANRSGDFTGKPRPAVIVQADTFATMDSVTICPFTSEAVGDSILRVAIHPSAETALNRVSWIAVDKITTIRRDRVGARMGTLMQADRQRLNGAIAVFLGLG
jgi:mRNA interferase MazF